MSSGQQTRHTNIRYIFIKDRVKEDNINIIYCLTEQMVADYFTKPLKATLSRRLRDVVMGITHPDFLLELIPPLVKEPVGIDKAIESKSQIVSN